MSSDDSPWKDRPAYLDVGYTRGGSTGGARLRSEHWRIARGVADVDLVSHQEVGSKMRESGLGSLVFWAVMGLMAVVVSAYQPGRENTVVSAPPVMIGNLGMGIPATGNPVQPGVPGSVNFPMQVTRPVAPWMREPVAPPAPPPVVAAAPEVPALVPGQIRPMPPAVPAAQPSSGAQFPWQARPRQ